MGMTPIDKDLLWIAREGFNAPLPEGWREEYVLSVNVCFLSRYIFYSFIISVKLKIIEHTIIM